MPLPPARRFFATTLLAFLAAGLIGAPAPAQAQERPLTLQEVVETALYRAPSILLEREQVAISQGRLRTGAGAFDPQFQATVYGTRNHTPVAQNLGVVGVQTEQMTYQLSLDKLFRSGIVVSPNVEVARTEVVSVGGTPYVQASVNLDVTMPLLRGRGRSATAGFEQAAAREYDAGRQDLRHTIAQSVRGAVTAYWSYVAAVAQVSIQAEAEARARRLGGEYQVLVEAGERPSADLEQLFANLSDRVAQRIAAEQGVVEARQTLGLAIGLPFEQIAALPLPASDFPARAAADLDALPAAPLVEQALRRRGDLLAAQERQHAATALVRAAENARKPGLDLQLRLGYAGLDQGAQLGQLFSAFNRNVGGANVLAVLQYSLPVTNQAARGRLSEQTARLEQTDILAEDLDRRIRSNVVVSVEALRRSVAELDASQEAIRLYRSSLDNESKKLQLGMSTLFDVLSVEDRLTNARLGEINAQLRHTQALVRLRFETGRLVQFEGSTVFVDVERLMRLPRADE